MQEGHLFAFTNKQLCDKDMGKYTYEKEMMATIHAINKCHPYLIGHDFWNKDKPS